MPEVYIEGLVFPEAFDEFDSLEHIMHVRAPFFGDALQVGLLPDELVGATKESLTLIKPAGRRAIEVFKSDDEAAFWIEWSGDAHSRVPVLDRPVDSLIFAESTTACRWLAVRAPGVEELKIAERKRIEGLNFFVNRLITHCVQIH